MKFAKLMAVAVLVGLAVGIWAAWFRDAPAPAVRPAPDIGVKDDGPAGDDPPFISEPYVTVDEARKAAARPPVRYGPSHRPTAAEKQPFADWLDRVAAEAQSAVPNLEGHLPAVKLMFDYLRVFEERAGLWFGFHPDGTPGQTDMNVWDLSAHGSVNRRYILDEPGAALWERAEVRRVALSADGREAIVAVEETRVGRPPWVVRYRLTRADGQWKAYDWATGRPWCWHVVGVADGERWRRPFGGVELGAVAYSVALACGAATAGAVEEAVAMTRAAPLPPAVAAWQAYAEGRLRLLRDDPAAAVPFFNAAMAADPTWPMGYTGRAQARVRLGRYREAFTDARRAASWLGE